MKLSPSETLNDPINARRILIVLAAAIFLFFVHHLLHVTPAFVALSAAAAALIWVQPDVNALLKKVEWSVLVFFGSLFIMVGGLEAAGVLELLVDLLELASGAPPMLLGISMMWVVAGLSAIVDNVPITIALIPVIQGLEHSGIDIQPLWWALVFGAGFGGNGTIIGSTANIFVSTLSEKTRTPITSKLWTKRGLPVMLVTLLIASLLYALLYRTF